jgi:mono/diheme cytochrome c family protein
MKGTIAGVLVVVLGCSPAGSTDETGGDEHESGGEAPEARPWRAAPVREGNALVRGAHDEALYVADEDHRSLRIVPLPFGSAPVETVALPGRPAQALALDDRVLVTIRDPGMLVSIVRERGEPMVAQRVALPGDAWGVALTPDERTALVTSAWTHTVTAVDLATGTTRWAVNVAREPRGIVVMADGARAYVTHLVGAPVTRIDGVDGDDPAVSRVDLPAGRFSAPAEDREGAYELGASLGYAAVLSPDGRRLFVPRHALGGVGWAPWFGRAVVDVLLTNDDSPLAPARSGPGLVDHHPMPDGEMVEDGAPSVALPLMWTVQPRAAVYRRSADTLLVASEGHGRLTELDARALDPSLHPVYRYELVHDGKDAERCGAPTGVALGADDATAFVWCRSTGEVARVPLKPRDFAAGPDGFPDAIEYLHVADDELDEPAARGKRLYYDARNDDARNAGVSGGLGCAACHPDGRDDGHVWLEHASGTLAGGPLPRSIPGIDVFVPGFRAGMPRQTPMLAGRVAAEGPYGWHGDERTLVDRILVGFGIHRWQGERSRYLLPAYRPNHQAQADALAAFLRRGLVPPPIEHRALTTEERRGKDLFESDDTQCALCHLPEREFTNRRVVTLGMGPSSRRSDVLDTPGFRVPSLLYVGGTAPYFHDGRNDSLGELVESIGDGMGVTSSLSADDRSALAAYLGTIGVVDAVRAPEEAVEPAPLPFPARWPESGSDDARLPTPPGDPADAALTPAPTRDEWAGAEELALARLPDSCRAWRVREWVRIACANGTRTSDPHHAGWLWEGEWLDSSFRTALIAGDPSGVDLTAAVVLPLRRGDRRLIEQDRIIVTGACTKYAQWMQAATFTISESWLAGDDTPDLVVTRYGRHPSTGTGIIADTCSF